MEKIGKIGISVAIVLALFISMPSLKTLADYFNTGNKVKNQQVTDRVVPPMKPRVNVSEEATGKDFGVQFIDDVKLYDEKGNEIPKKGGVIHRNEKLKVVYFWSIPDDAEVKSGDYMTIPVPKEAGIMNSVNFPVIDKKTNEKVGEAYLDHKSNKITMVFTDYPETHSNLDGVLEFQVELKVDSNTENIKIPIEFETSDKPVIIEIEVPGEEEKGEEGESPIVEKDLVLGKYGLQGAENGELVWIIYVNERLDDLSDVVLEDYIGANQTLVPDSFGVWSGTGVRYDGSLVDTKYHPYEELDHEFYDDHFIFNLGDIGKTVYQFQYRTRIDEEYEIIEEADFENRVVLKASEAVLAEETRYATYVTGSGSGSGDATKKFAVTERFVDKEDGKKLHEDIISPFEVPFKEKAIFKTDTTLIDGYELVEYVLRSGDFEKTTQLSDGQTIKLEVEEDTEMTYFYQKSEFAPHIYLRTKDNQLVIHYRNVDQLVVFIDGVQYETYDVLAQETDENISTPVRVNSDRTEVRVEGKLKGNIITNATLNSK